MSSSGAISLEIPSPATITPFLYPELLELMRSVLTNFVAKSVIDAAIEDGTFTKIDLDKQENLKSSENMDIGFGAKSRLKKLSPLQIVKFRRNFQLFCICVILPESIRAVFSEISPLRSNILFLSHLDSEIRRRFCHSNEQLVGSSSRVIIRDCRSS